MVIVTTHVDVGAVLLVEDTAKELVRLNAEMDALAVKEHAYKIASVVVEGYVQKTVLMDARQDVKDVRAPAKDFVEIRVKKLAVKVVSLLVG